MNITIANNFRPFSFDEKIKPFLMYKEDYEKADNDFTTLAAQAKVWQDRAMRDKNPLAYAQYKKYVDDLSAAAEGLGTTGKINRRALSRMKARYASDIIPIETAAKRQDALAEEQRKMDLQNPTMLWQRRASDMSLDDFIKNPEADYGQFYSGALLTQQVATKAASLAKELQDTGENGKKARAQLEQIMPYQYRLLERRGFNSSEVLAAIMNDRNANPILTNLINSTIESSGINNWADRTILDKARAYANEGLWSAIGPSEYKYITDQAGLNVQQADLQDRNNAHQFERQNQKEKDDLLNQLALGSNSFLQVSGKVDKLKGILDKMFYKENLKASYFGKSTKNGKTVDPMKVYEEATKAYNEAFVPIVDSFNTPSYYTGLAYTSSLKAANKAKNDVLKRYGVTRILTEEEYKTLKEFGFNMQYNNKKYKTMADFTKAAYKAIDTKAAEMSYYSTAMDDYSLIETTIRSNLSKADANNMQSGLIYELSPDGKQGKPVKYKDLGFKNDNTSARVEDIAYSAYIPNKIIATIGGKSYLLSPVVLGGNYTTLLSNAQAALKEGTSPDIVTMNTTAALIGHLKAFNSLKGK